MKKYELCKYDIALLVNGTFPKFDKMIEFEDSGLGHWTGGFCDVWNWNLDALLCLSDEVLWDMYLENRENTYSYSLYLENQ